MSKEKQIEEMAHDLCHWRNGKGCTFGSIPNKHFPCRYDCNAFTDAERLYNAGYRKQSENTIELPCKVGQTVFFYTCACDKDGEKKFDILEGEVISFSVQNEGLCLTAVINMDKFFGSDKPAQPTEKGGA